MKQEFKEDTKDENSLSDYLKKPGQRLNEYLLHLQVRQSGRLVLVLHEVVFCIISHDPSIHFLFQFYLKLLSSFY